MRLDSISNAFKFYCMLLAHRTARNTAALLPYIYISYTLHEVIVDSCRHSRM